MKSNATFDQILAYLEKAPILSAFLIALTLRWLFLLIGFEDFWGDAHHSLIMSKITLENGFVYSDFKDRHLAWLPLYRYWGSFIILVTGTYSLLVMNIINSILGALTVSVSVWLGTKLLDKKSALLIGLTVAIMPYLIVFSVASMAEMMGGLLLLAWFTALFREKHVLVLLFGCLAVLTREELTILIGLSVVPLLYFKNYKGALYSMLGIGLGLGIWSWMAYVNSGNPLNWLLERFESTTRSTSYYAEEGNIWINNVLVPITTLVQAFPLVIFFIWLKRPTTTQTLSERKWFLLSGYITISFWVFFFIAQFKVIANPDPRFFVLTLPISIVWFFSLWERGYLKPFVSKNLVFGFLALTLFQLVVPYYRQYNLEPRKAVGEWLQTHTSEEIIWSDMAVSIVESKRDPAHFLSTDKLLIAEYGGFELEASQIKSEIIEHDIQYITSYNAPFNHTHMIWPQLELMQPFEWEGLTFIPVFEYSPYRMETFSIHGFLRQQFEAPLHPSSVWKVYSN